MEDPLTETSTLSKQCSKLQVRLESAIGNWQKTAVARVARNSNLLPLGLRVSQARGRGQKSAKLQPSANKMLGILNLVSSLPAYARTEQLSASQYILWSNSCRSELHIVIFRIMEF